ncbi:hypothetical protein GCM10009841_20650 [Microlunatus panaciterrae]|nr:alpha-galactosidase [Microlunatus panaciterrae]
MEFSALEAVHLPEDVARAVSVATSAGDVEVRAADGVVELLVTPATNGVVVRMELVLDRAVGYWHAGQGASRTLAADWSGKATTSLVNDVPAGCLYDAAGRALLGWAADELVAEVDVAYGVSEERKNFALEVTTRDDRPLRLLLTSAGSLTETLRRLAAWMESVRPVAALPSPATAKEPVYSTWYTFTQDINADLVEAEATLAAQLGYGSVFIDDGWQLEAHGRGYAGCGDWLPDPAKFADFAGHVERLHELGLKVVVWIAPVLLGERSTAFAAWSRFAPSADFASRCRVLDPRFPEVREHLASTCLRLVEDYGIDGLKIDFLEQAMVYQGQPAEGDMQDVGVAMQTMLGQIRDRLAQAGHAETMIEFRQPYVSPAIASYGNILRAGDCPADAVVNRRSTLDARLLATGQVIHADPMMWSPAGGPAAVAQQLYGGWFAVPQISMRLEHLSTDQSTALAAGLALWRRLRPVLLEGTLSVEAAELGYPLVRSSLGDQHVVGVYAHLVVDLTPLGTGQVTVINATPADRLVLRIGAAGARVASTVDVLGDHNDLDRDLAPGVVDLEVPPFGAVEITLH